MSPPMIDVPINSPITANKSFFVREKSIPERNAPIIEPGNASKLPDPIIFLIREVANAAAVAYFVPIRVARKILSYVAAEMHVQLPKEMKTSAKELHISPSSVRRIPNF